MRKYKYKLILAVIILMAASLPSCTHVNNTIIIKDGEAPAGLPIYAQADYDDQRSSSYQERLTNARIDAVKARLDGMDRAIDVKTAELDRRLLLLNELRGDVVRDREQFVRRDAYTARAESIDKWVFTTEQRITAIETRSVVWMAAIGVFFALLQIAAHVLLHRGKKE